MLMQVAEAEFVASDAARAVNIHRESRCGEWIVRTYPLSYLRKKPRLVEKLVRSMPGIEKAQREAPNLAPIEVRLECVREMSSKFWLAVCFRFEGCKLHNLFTKECVREAMHALLQNLKLLHERNFMQGGLSIDQVYFDTKTDRVTLTDWA